MKKVFFLLAMISAAIAAQAQTYDTLWSGDREPTFYYWDDNWMDRYSEETFNFTVVEGFSGCQPEFARYCYTDSVLKVIGIAAVLEFVERVDEYFTTPAALEQAYKNMDKEYLRLYETDSNGNMELLAEESWNNFTPRYLMQVAQQPGHSCRGTLTPVREVYFDSARTVRDSFYVSATSNNYRHHDSLPYVYVMLVTSSWNNRIYDLETDANAPGPKPRHFKRKLHGTNFNDFHHHITDTNWHTFMKNSDGIAGQDTIPYTTMPYTNRFMFIFPIIDTSCHGEPLLPDDSCQAPTGLSFIYSNGGTAVLSWNSPASLWDLCIAPQGSTPEQGTITQCNNNVASITGLDTSLCYTAWVRTRCSASSFSHWSDSVDFCMNGGTVDVPSVVDSHTFLFPNPASDQVQVASSFRISTVEVYSLSGQLVSRVKADGISATLDTRSLPSATYLVRITTNHGITVKKLVVE